jgi:uncharacterized BrkB/YihY/UPF0761 family membrane protein
MTLQTACQVTIGLGVVSALAVLVALLALQDIYHGEADLSLEWNVVRAAFLIIIVFHAFALATVRKSRAVARGSGFSS